MVAGKVLTAAWLLRHFGPGWALYRLSRAFSQRTGLLAWRLPAQTWEARPLAIWLRPGVPSQPEAYVAWRQQQAGHLFIEASALEALPAMFDVRDLLAEVDAALAGRWRYFEHIKFDTGFPPDWHLNPLTGQRAPANRHWSQIGDFDHGDIKLIWEPSRFGMAYKLVRAYAATGNDRYPAAFWALVEDWREANPPHLGPNWKCGQEAAFRIMAWCFALYGFADSCHTTAQRVARLAAMIAAHADRIERNMGYARSQKNNHAISEGVGLWTVGLLFPEFKDAKRWQEKGRQVLEEEARRPIYPDGAYIQHSTNYHRLMLHDYLWAIRLGDLNGQPLSDELRERVSQAYEFLYQLQDAETGQVPNYGANDGALILPLNTCDYSDFHPVLNTVHYLYHGERLYPPGPWDEDLLWLFGPEALQASVKEKPQYSLSADDGGYYTLRSRRSWAMLRCAAYRDRPSHADQLHFDLWWRGINIACDAGTYLYNGEPPWDNGLVSTNVHNTVTVDGQDQMIRAGRFLWINWARGRVRQREYSQSNVLEYWEGEHDGYQRLPKPITHQRGIAHLSDDAWLVVDDLIGEGEHIFLLHWLLPDFPYRFEENTCRLILTTEHGSFSIQVMTRPETMPTLSLVRADPVTIRGWRSRYYGKREPALSLALEMRSTALARFVTLFASGSESQMMGDIAKQLTAIWSGQSVQMELAQPGAHSIGVPIVRVLHSRM